MYGAQEVLLMHKEQQMCSEPGAYLIRLKNKGPDLSSNSEG